MRAATDFDEILLQFFWVDLGATRGELSEGARQKKGQEFRKSGPVIIFSQPRREMRCKEEAALIAKAL
jgi:hypothetical protein